MLQDPDVPLEDHGGGTGTGDDGQEEAGMGWATRTADAGQSVIDIGGMVADLETARQARGGDR